MGGYGSGEHNRTSRLTTEDCETLSLRELRSRGILPPTGSGPVEVERYLDRERMWIWLNATPQPRGGMRWWIACPTCDRRSGKLWRAPERQEWLCRVCINLGYRSRR
jgi:hypothetical protein